MSRLPPRSSDLRGQAFGSLTALFVGTKDQNRNTRWVCMCNCGQTTVVRAANLLAGATKSCGCLRKTRQAKAWAEAKSRTPPKTKTKSKSNAKTKTKTKTKTNPKAG